MHSDEASEPALESPIRPVAFTALPPVPMPVTLTARPRLRSLRDHFVAFLNVNNSEGFAVDVAVHVPNDTIGEVMQLAATLYYVTEKRLKCIAKVIKKKSNGAIIHSTALELVSRVFGYKSWYEARRLMRNGVLPNRRRDRDRIGEKIFGTLHRKVAPNEVQTTRSRVQRRRVRLPYSTLSQSTQPEL